MRNRKNWNVFYAKDEILFSAKVEYTLSGMTWKAIPCAYCGDPATHEDHVFPIAALKKLYASGRQFPDREVLKIVPACAECNLLASDNVFYTFDGKKGYVKEKLYRRYRRYINIVTWEDNEIEELKGELKRYISASKTYRDIILERLKF